MKYELDLQDAGRYEMAVLITENMMKQGLTPEQTGLTVDEVEELRKRIR